jgi:hypothetical protein
MESKRDSREPELVINGLWGHRGGENWGYYGWVAVEPTITLKDKYPCEKCQQLFTLECAHCLRKEIDDLKVQLKKLELYVESHLTYAPNGIGYEQAKVHFNQLSKSL